MNKTGLLDNLFGMGALLSALGCTACFPALAGIAASLGLGVLSQYEGMLINTLLPLLAGAVLVINILAAVYRKYPLKRSLAGMVGPLMILATLYLFWSEDWSSWLFYVGMVLMFIVAVLDLLIPAAQKCMPAMRRGGSHG